MKLSRKIISFAMLTVMLFAMAIPSFAAENEVMPRLNNLCSAEAIFVIEEDGEATVSYTCFGYEGITTRIVVETKIEKKFLWWWNDVDGASWTDEAYDCFYSGYHTIQLTKTGTYRASITYTVYGSGGEADVVTSEIEKKY